MNNKRVEEFSLSGKYLSQFGTPGSGNGQFDFLIPQAFARVVAGIPILPAISSNGTIWVADMGNYRVEEFSSAGIYESQFGSNGSSNGQFGSTIQGIAIDASGNIWVTDYNNNRVEEFSSTGIYESQLGCTSGACSAGSSNGQFNSPWGITIDASGNIWVADQINNRVQEFSATGTYESQFGSYGSSTGQFSYPANIAIDASGNIWVVDEGNNRVEEFSSTGTYKSQLGCTSGACSSGSSNGQFYYPSGIAIDASGNIWVGDTLNNRVEEFSSTGIYESQLGCTSGACSAGSSNGQFNSPWGITIH
jgi:secreted PhoX family phosphatase